MAYSRWGASDWYVFWRSDSDPPYLEMWYAGTPFTGATFDELDGATEDRLAALVPAAPRESLGELMEHVRDFCADVHDMRAGKEPSRW